MSARPAAALQGAVEELALPDVLQLLDLGRKSGVLRVRTSAPGDEGVIVLDEGRVVGAAVGAPDERGTRGGEESSHDPLVTRALAGPPSATEAAVFEIVTWTSGGFAFAPTASAGQLGEPRPPGARPRGAAVDALLMESARRADEWARLAVRVPHVGVVPAPAGGAGGGVAPLSLAPAEWALLAAVDGVRDLRALARALGADPLAAARALDRLAAEGLVELHDPLAAAVDPDARVPSAHARSSTT